MADTDPNRPPADQHADQPVDEHDDERVRADEHVGEHAADPTPEDRAEEDAAAERALAERRDGTDPAPVARAAEPQPVLEPAEEAAPEAPKRGSNRLVGTAWVLLAAGLFQVVYFGALAGFIALIAGPQLVAVNLPVYFTTPLAWLPVLVFFLLFELTVLIFNRAGRFLYVVASLVVGVLVYVATVLLTTILLRGDIGDRATLEQAFVLPYFAFAGLAAREVMLWTGVAIGARGTRLRKRNRAAQQAYRAELAER